MRRLLLTELAFAFITCSLVPSATAQTPSAKSGEAVRERRATATEATKDETTTDTNARAKEESATKAQTGAATAQTGAATEQTRGATDSGVESLRAQIASEKDAASRARLQQSLAERLAQTGRKTEAVELLRAVLAEDVPDPQLFYNVGNALARFDDSEGAIEAYRKAIAQREGNYARAHHNLGVVLTRLGRWDEAQEALTTALKLENYTYAGASYSLGRLYALRGEAGLAIKEWTRTLQIKPDHADAAVALARALAEDGNPEAGLAILDAFKDYANRRDISVPREVTAARAEIAAAVNVSGKGRNEKGAGDARDKKNASVGREASKGAQVSSSARVSGDRDATKVLREARQPDVLRPLVVDRETYDLLRRARDARNGNRNEEAIGLYRRAIESNGGFFAPANLELGYTFAGLRRNEEAIASLLVVIQQEGTRYPIAFYHLGRFYEHMNRLAAAAESFKRAAELMGDESPQFFVDLSRVREHEGKYVEALAAAVRYVHEMEKTGKAPDWARARVARLQKKLADRNASPAKN
jgi:tetratricopeptide (TPR) repeat protein